MIRTELDAYAAILARVLIGGFFALSGASSLLQLGEAAEQAAEAGVPVALLVVFLAAILKVLFGFLIMIKHHTKLASMSLIVFTLLSTAIFYNPLRWDDFPQGEIIFTRNFAILGGLLFLYAHSRGIALVRGGELKRLGGRVVPDAPREN